MTIGTPYRGSLNALGFLENGLKKGIGPFGLDLAPLLRSCTSVYQLLPLFPCIAIDCVMQRVTDLANKGGVLNHVDAQRAADARKFHQEIQDKQVQNAKDAKYIEDGPTLVPIVGIEQPTAQSAVVTDGKLTLVNNHGGKDLGGDGTVPRVSGTPIEMENNPREVYAAECHGALQNADGTLANLKGVLTRDRIDYRKFQRAEDSVMLTLALDDVVLPGEALTVRVRPSEGNPKIRLTLTPLSGGHVMHEMLTRDAEPGWQQGTFALAPGVWRIIADTEGATPVSDLVVVAQP